MNKTSMEQYCELIAALKIRTMNKNGRHISTVRAIEVLETIGIESSYGFIKPAKGILVKATINRYLKLWGFDQHNLMKNTPAVRFQAQHSNECWQFDLSPSDLKHVKEPLWFDKNRGKPILMIYSIVDDRSGVCYHSIPQFFIIDICEHLNFIDLHFSVNI
ncbi:MAG: hypothetical protein HRT38_20935 [Alteromonadaceae bacterium]|nr:hypothetical protein [Alteromonadaceae bacterium]